jgi:FlaA1/EpsC-like NDP-sugar epimerase
MSGRRIIIVGAGFAGISLAREIKNKGILGRVNAFLDDDPEKIGTVIDGIPVAGPIKEAKPLRERFPADEAIISIPSADNNRLACIYGYLKDAGFPKIQILPSLSQIIDGSAHLIQTREIDPQDLLGRTPVIIPLKESLRYLKGKRVLITGAGGSIGSELSRQLLSGGAERLYLFGHGENSIYEIEQELRLLQEEGVGEKATIVPVVGDLQDTEFIRFIMNRLKADVVFHCAAYKHVPMVESNPVAAISNNVFGTKNLVEAAAACGVSRFVFISTDKAVDPISIYGASKLIAEHLVLSSNGGTTSFMVVRFGNVLGSRGSIVPLFRKQILKGGPVTVTHPEASRFFMTIPEAASLVLKTGGVGKGNSLYILDMQEPIRIQDVAEQMIRFFGYTPDREVPIRYIGLRPGEKVHEQLWKSLQRPVATEHKRILEMPDVGIDIESLESLLRELVPICFFSDTEPESYRNRKILRRRLRRYVPTLELPENEPEY